MSRTIRSILRHWLLLLVLLFLPLNVDLPSRWDPRVPLDLDAEPNALTRYKLMRASNEPVLCRSVLAQARWRYTPIADEVTERGCGYRNAVRIDHTSAEVGEPFALSCRAALSLALWERHVMQPSARKHF
jgi:hypothetical protein